MAVIGAGVGNVLEWYDFTVYAYLAGTLGKLFFDSSNETAAVLATFAVFGVGFVARPLGGILIGMFGDRYGRKPALLLLTFGMIAVSTGVVGLLPTYASIGLAAPILLVIARLAQGISAGGEWGGAASFLVEWAPPKRRGLFGSMHPVRDLYRPVDRRRRHGRADDGARHRGDDELGLAGAVPDRGAGGADRLHGAATYPRDAGISPRWSPSMRRPPRRRTFSMGRAMVLAFSFPVLQSVLTYVFLSYFPTFGQRYLGMTASAALWSTVLATAIMGASSLASGALSDRYGRRTCLLTSCGLSLVLAYPMLKYDDRCAGG